MDSSNEKYSYTSLSRVENFPVFEKIYSVCKENQNKFSIELIKKQKKDMIQYKSHLIKRAQFDDGWFCFYTDNLGEHQFFECKEIVLTVHGFPGNWRDWQPIETYIGNNFCRWINLFVPGFDGETETNRGSYKGYLTQLVDLVQRLIKEHLKISQKMILFGYSGGNIVVRLLQKKYPEICKAHINLVGPTIIWNPAHVYMYHVFNTFDREFKLREHPEQLEDPKFREKIYEKFKLFQMGDYFVYEKVPIWCDTHETLMIWFKKFLSFPEGWSKFYEIGHNQQDILRFYATGDIDPLVDSQLLFYEFYHNTYLRQVFKITDEETKQKILSNKYLSQLKNFNFENIQENFLFMFPRTGHTIHIKRAYELAFPLKCFISLINILPDNYYEINKQQNPKNPYIGKIFMPKL
ncbi:hypothetical protein ABPG73_002854 [Tetrahymena malaccensis]